MADILVPAAYLSFQNSTGPKLDHNNYKENIVRISLKMISKSFKYVLLEARSLGNST